MEIIDQSWEWIQRPTLPLELIELAGRTCYKSEKEINAESARKFVKTLIDKGHESVIEHISVSVKFITNRGVSHELVRHRLASYSQESTRYVKYCGDMEFIIPVWFCDWSPDERELWKKNMEQSETACLKLLYYGSRPEQAREVLPNSLKTEIVMTANLREWRHVFQLRCSKAAHPQMRALMLSCLEGFASSIPVIFDDLASTFFN